MMSVGVKEASCLSFLTIWLTTTAVGLTYAQSAHFSTYLGGSAFEFAAAIDSDDDGNIYVAGITASDDFPTLNSMLGFMGGDYAGVDAFVAKFTPSGELVFSTLIGGSGDELVNDIAVGADGSVWIAGGTNSQDFPVVNALQPFVGGALLGSDGFLTKLSPDGTKVEWSSCIGGDGEEAISDIALDSTGQVYFTGGTTSFDFPTTEGSFQPEFSKRGFLGMEAFFGKLVQDENLGHVIAYSSFLGGGGDELGSRIEVDDAERPYVTGYTNSEDFPTLDPFQASIASSDTSGGDIFLAAFSADGVSLEYGTFLGGDEDEQPTGLRVSENGVVHLIGWTRSSDFPTTDDAVQVLPGGGIDVFVSRFVRSAETVLLEYSSYMGGLGVEQQFGLPFVDEGGLIYLTGITDNESFPAIVGEFGGGLSDAFAYRFDPASGLIDQATFIGGNNFEESAGMVRSILGRTCVALTTYSDDLETINAVQSAFGTSDDKSGGDVYVTCFGGSAVAIEDDPTTPARFRLDQNHPNPFTRKTTIRFDLPEAGHVELSIFDAFGRVVDTLIDGEAAPGHHELTYDGGDLASGIYVYRIRFASSVDATKRMVIVR